MTNSLRRLRWILSPSIISAPVALVLAGVAWGSAGWSYITHSQLFYEQLFGAYGAVTILQIQPYSVGALQATILNGPTTYYVLLAAGSIIAGVSIYLILESISHIVNGASLFFREVHEDTESAHSAARDSLIRLGLHVLGIVAWAIYWLIFANLIVPLSIVALEQSLNAINSGDAWAWLVLPPAFIILVVAVHLHATFARLTFLRIRLLGGYDAELSRLESQHEGT